MGRNHDIVRDGEMNWETWKGFYWAIVDDMGYSVERDREAAMLLRELLLKHDDHLKPHDIEMDARAYVFGAGPSLDESIEIGDFKGGTLIAADGATSALMEHGLTPDVVVTDLDGRMSHILEASRSGTVTVVHAHGDNMERLREWVPRLRSVLGTCQSEPLDVVYNFGGFTDGDRAAFLAEHLGAREILLIGFDFGNTVGRWSKPWLRGTVPAWEEKRKKLRIARELLMWLKKHGKARLTFYRVRR